MVSQNEKDNSSSGNKSWASEHALVEDLMVYLYDRLREVMKADGHRPDVINACMPKWYLKAKDKVDGKKD